MVGTESRMSAEQAKQIAKINHRKSARARFRRSLSLYPLLIPGLIMIFLNAVRVVDGPYPFFRVHDQSVPATVLWIFALMGVIGAISAIIAFISSGGTEL